ncbi:MAG TPA: cupin domain-containing protein [Streptosporangiaceae bacterium]
MHIITAGQAPRFELSGVEFTGYASPSRGSAGLCAWQIRVSPGLVSDQPHSLDQDEVFMITSGVITLSPDGPELSAGDCVVVPAGTPIQLSNPGNEFATAHVMVRAGFSATMADGSPVGTPPWAR